MTVTAELGAANDARLAEYAPDVDIWGINSYEGAPWISDRLTDRGYDGPFIITEYGPPGPWAAPTTSRGSAIETGSAEKASWYELTYEQTIARDARSLGGYAFIWMPGDDATDTWYSLFREDGRPTVAVESMEHNFLGAYPDNRAPSVSIESAQASAELDAGDVVEAALTASDPDGDALSYRWSLRHENDGSGVWQSAWTDFSCFLPEADGPEVALEAPAWQGTYRLYGEAWDGDGHTSLESIVFHVGDAWLGDATPLPVGVANSFVSSGWMGDFDRGSLSTVGCDHPELSCDEVCTQFTYSSSGGGWAGIYWQYPANNWGAEPGLEIAPGATRVRFVAWSETPGAVVSFKVGLSGVDPVDLVEHIALTDVPTEYVIELPDVDYERVITPLGWTAGLAADETELVFSIAGARWE